MKPETEQLVQKALKDFNSLKNIKSVVEEIKTLLKGVKGETLVAPGPVVKGSDSVRSTVPEKLKNQKYIKLQNTGTTKPQIINTENKFGTIKPKVPLNTIYENDNEENNNSNTEINESSIINTGIKSQEQLLAKSQDLSITQGGKRKRKTKKYRMKKQKTKSKKQKK